jgi:hypothetical protein
MHKVSCEMVRAQLHDSSSGYSFAPVLHEWNNGASVKVGNVLFSRVTNVCDQFGNKARSPRKVQKRQSIRSYSKEKGPYRQAQRSGSGAHSQARAGSVLEAKCSSILARFMETITSADVGSSTSSLSKEMQDIQVLQHSVRGRAIGVHRRHLHAREAET